MKTLHLTLKKKWFDMILSGEKKEEYRELKPYWATWLKDRVHSEFIDYDTITFKNGYTSDAPEIVIELNNITIREGVKEWGAEADKMKGEDIKFSYAKRKQ